MRRPPGRARRCFELERAREAASAEQQANAELHRARELLRASCADVTYFNLWDFIWTYLNLCDPPRALVYDLT